MDNEILENEEETSILTLTDENGVDTDFEYLDCIDYEGKEYLVLMPADEAATDIIILEVEPVDEETENYLSVQDETILNAVYDIFKEKYKDVLTFEEYASIPPAAVFAAGFSVFQTPLHSQRKCCPFLLYNADRIPLPVGEIRERPNGAFPERRYRYEKTDFRSLPAGFDALHAFRLRRPCRSRRHSPRDHCRSRNHRGNRGPYGGSHGRAGSRASGRHDRSHRHRYGKAL